MNGDLSKFEQESTKTPIWLPVVGVVFFFAFVVFGVMCQGEAPPPPDGGAITHGQSE